MGQVLMVEGLVPVLLNRALERTWQRRTDTLNYDSSQSIVNTENTQKSVKKFVKQNFFQSNKRTHVSFPRTASVLAR